MAEQPRHLPGRLEMALCVGGEAEAGGVDAATFADAGQHVLERPARGSVVEHVVGGHQRHPLRRRDLGQQGEAADIVATVAVAGGEIQAAAEAGAVVVEVGGEAGGVGGFRGQRDQPQSLRMGGDVGAAEPARAFLGPPVAHGQQARQPGIGGAIAGEGEQPRPVFQLEPAADHQPDAGALGREMRPHHPRQAVAVGDRQGGEAQRPRRQRQLLGMAGAVEEGKGAGDVEFGVGGGCGHARSGALRATTPGDIKQGPADSQSPPPHPAGPHWLRSPLLLSAPGLIWIDSPALNRECRSALGGGPPP